MQDFQDRLMALRSGAKAAAKGTAANMKKGFDGTARKEMDKAKMDQSREMIRKNFGNEENYRKNIEETGNEDLFTPPYKKAAVAVGDAVRGTKSFLERLMQARKK